MFQYHLTLGIDHIELKLINQTWNDMQFLSKDIFNMTSSLTWNTESLWGLKTGISRAKNRDYKVL